MAETESSQEIILSKCFPIGIIDAEYPVELGETIKAVRRNIPSKPVHFIDYCAWAGTASEIRRRLSSEGYEIDDHHNGFANTGVLTATASIKERQERGELSRLERIVLTFRPNFDGDLIFATFMALNPSSKYRALVEEAARFSDCTMFGGEAFDSSYSLKSPAEILAFAVSQLIYEETVANFPRELSFLKGFPAGKPGIARAVLKGYGSISAKLPSLLELVEDVRQREDIIRIAERYLERVRGVYGEAVQRGRELIPQTMTYIDLRREPLDKMGPMPFWLAEGNGQFIKDSAGKITPLVLRETGAGYVLASADNRRAAADKLKYDLTKSISPLSALSGKPWAGKDTVLFGARGPGDASPEMLAEEIKKVYGL